MQGSSRRRGREPVALIAAEELAGWLETAYLLRPPKNARRLVQAGERAAGDEGETMDVDELRTRYAAMAEDNHIGKIVLVL